ncbi:hypothetical protein [Bergeriella denitrificans]|uniref:hypothetical protein n=1 Tax=Bergeriella denitrificans TaxID=494 RepID=UPI00155A04D9|nr:hypothetical protein [Bergeriella denitrificans]
MVILAQSHLKQPLHGFSDGLKPRRKPYSVRFAVTSLSGHRAQRDTDQSALPHQM